MYVYCVYLLSIYKYTHKQYMSIFYMFMHLDIHILIFYVTFKKYLIYKHNICFLNIYMHMYLYIHNK